MSDLLVGKHAIFTKIESTYDEEARKMREVSRTTYHGMIAALVVVGGQPRRVGIVMLYDDGSLREHALETITVEGEPQPSGAFR